MVLRKLVFYCSWVYWQWNWGVAALFFIYEIMGFGSIICFVDCRSQTGLS